MQNIELFNHLFPSAEAFCKSILDYVRTNTNLHELPIIIRERFEFGDDSVRKYSDLIPSFEHLFRHKCPPDIIANFQETILFIGKFADAKILTNHSIYIDNEAKIINPVLLNIAHSLVADYVQSEMTFEYCPDKFTRSFSLWINSYTTPTKSQIIVPLIGFSCSISHIDLIDGFQIIAFTNEFKNRLFSEQGFVSTVYKDSEFIKITHYLINMYDECDHNTIGEDIGNIITGLRLIQGFDVGARGIFFSRHPSRKSDFQLGYMGLDDFNISMNNEKYEFLNSNIDPLIEIVKIIKLVKTKNNKNLDAALRRFNLSYSRKMPEDSLIDWTISLESTVLASYRDELKYRLSLIGSLLIKKIRNPKETSDILKAMYDVRSNIVHGGLSINDCNKNFKNIAESNKEFLSKSANVTREILKEYVMRSVSENKDIPSINKELEVDILSFEAYHS